LSISVGELEAARAALDMVEQQMLDDPGAIEGLRKAHDVARLRLAMLEHEARRDEARRAVPAWKFARVRYRTDRRPSQVLNGNSAHCRTLTDSPSAWD
jgi:hypothetical protein